MPNTLYTYFLLAFYYSLFWFGIFVSSKNRTAKLKDVLSGNGDYDSLLVNLIAGIFFLGLGTTVLFKRNSLDIHIIEPAWNSNYAIWILTVAALVIGISSGLKVSRDNKATHSLPLHLPFSFIAIRTLFLIIYECFFRGAMLFIAINDWGIAVAIALNLVLYVLAHWFDKQERYGSLIIGPILCIITINHNSVWPAIMIHLSLALSYEITLMMKYKPFIKKSFV